MNLTSGWCRQVQDWQHWWSWGKWRSIWNNSYDKWHWATKLWQILSVLAFWKMGFFLHRDSSPVVEVNTVKARSFFFMVCQKGKVKTSWWWMASWESSTQKCLALGKLDDSMRYDEIARNLSGRHTEETPGLPARAFFTAQRLGKPNMSWTITINKENQGKQT